MTWLDVLDILLVWILLYQLYKLVRGSVAARIFAGIISIYLVYLIVRAAGMELLTSILDQFIGVGVIAALIVFQQEIRRFLLLIGKTTSFNESFFRNIFKRSGQEDHLNLIPIIEAAKSMAATNTGGLIVFAKGSELKFYAESGDELNAQISKRLLQSIFFKNSPLHDGAVIIASNRIKAARCILPVSEDRNLPANLGLRHRAALGMAEVTDAIILSVSEETGQLSLAYDGKLESNLTPQEVRDQIQDYLFDTDQELAEQAS